jgi:hypothetical protein
MNKPTEFLRRHATLLVSVTIVFGLYVLTRDRTLSKIETQ